MLCLLHWIQNKPQSLFSGLKILHCLGLASSFMTLPTLPYLLNILYVLIFQVLSYLMPFTWVIHCV